MVISHLVNCPGKDSAYRTDVKRGLYASRLFFCPLPGQPLRKVVPVLISTNKLAKFLNPQAKQTSELVICRPVGPTDKLTGHLWTIDKRTGHLWTIDKRTGYLWHQTGERTGRLLVVGKQTS